MFAQSLFLYPESLPSTMLSQITEVELSSAPFTRHYKNSNNLIQRVNNGRRGLFVYSQVLFWQSSYSQGREEGDKGAPSLSDSWLEQLEPLEMGVDMETTLSETEQPFTVTNVFQANTHPKRNSSANTWLNNVDECTLQSYCMTVHTTLPLYSYIT